jgi:serine/threonine-protein kinase
MGVVYEAEQQMGTATRKVAIKTLHAHLSQDPSVAARFHRECGTIAQLEHPNTIKVYDFGATSDGTLYIAMEFVKGKSLNDLIREGGPQPAERVLRIVKQIAGSLAEAHSLNIIHRDLKPENVVLTQRAGEQDVVKLLDFGIAARTESADAEREQKLTQQGMVLGTPPYMSPEQFTGKALDPRSDIYSLSVMTYEMLTGRLPFDAKTPWQWATEHMTSQPLPFEATAVSDKVPTSMRAAIMRALSKDKDRRQASVTEFYREIAGESSSGAAAAVAAPAAAFGGSTGTAAMEAAPDFSARGPAPGGPMPTPANMPAPTPGGGVYMQPAPPPPKRGGKGLVIALGGLAAAVLVAIVIVAAQQMGPSEQPTAAATTALPTVTQVDPTPTATAEKEPAEEPEPEPADEPEPDPTPRPKKGEEGTPKPKTTSTSKPKETPPAETSKPAASGGAACDACRTAAQSGDFSGAAANYSACSDAQAKVRCKTTVTGRAAGEAGAAANNGDCARAKSIVAAANQMGAGGPAQRKIAAKCP